MNVDVKDFNHPYDESPITKVANVVPIAKDTDQLVLNADQNSAPVTVDNHLVLKIRHTNHHKTDQYTV